ncbi:D-sedoheptulose 7-phosphate isomerase [Nonomuraea muscovyensis]|uniref:D-sedoheptulose 7-phosphate isomerase n=1 Tax=Nonomuraea muscovyensis TaxID=1124761 RepID=A0A7X0C7N5_9ACTN|nr:HypC/HybG/HupF family hydrogenase formation chaperone [Nonomuraea muscovyensis]MBB6348626.1 D-sedoheptulose 7-phosphate isomerase [Nonomuraea muscovyensis]
MAGVRARTTSLLKEAAARRAGPGRALVEDAGLVVRAAIDMAARFRRGGRLLAFGAGAAATDAGHLAVEFTHPVIVGKRALPAISLANDASLVSGIAVSRGYGAVFSTQVRMLGRPEDVAVGFAVDDRCGDVLGAFAAARQLGMLTVALVDGALVDGALVDRTLVDGTLVDHVLDARCADPRIAGEAHMTTYHLLWELVHVFLDDPGLLDEPDLRGERGLRADPGPARPAPYGCDADATCVTCADTAVPVHVTELRPGGLAVVDTGGGTEEISVALVEARVGDTVLVHAGEAIAVLGGDAS